MKNIAIIGASGFVGSHIVSEALHRDYAVDAFTRSGHDISGATAHKISLSHTQAVVDVINNHDFTVIAVADRTNPQNIIDAHHALISARPQGRFLVVGGAGSLEVNGIRLHETPGFPEEYKLEAQTFSQVLDDYQNNAHGLNWTLISPSPELADGIRTGSYVVGNDEPVGDYVSAQDLAVAIIDEGEQSAHIRQRFTVASEKISQ